jgi:hypothetical protein
VFLTFLAIAFSAPSDISQLATLLAAILVYDIEIRRFQPAEDLIAWYVPGGNSLAFRALKLRLHFIDLPVEKFTNTAGDQQKGPLFLVGILPAPFPRAQE